MKRWMLGLLVGSTLLACAAESQAARQRRYPPRYERGSNFQLTLKNRANGTTSSQISYPGYRNGFPPPAWLYYGYPHSGDGYLSPGF